MLAQPILKGALCSPLMQLAAANDEPGGRELQEGETGCDDGRDGKPRKIHLVHVSSPFAKPNVRIRAAPQDHSSQASRSSKP